LNRGSRTISALPTTIHTQLTPDRGAKDLLWGRLAAAERRVEPGDLAIEPKHRDDRRKSKPASKARPADKERRTENLGCKRRDRGQQYWAQNRTLGGRIKQDEQPGGKAGW
jgi:hypothetical protein